MGADAPHGVQHHRQPSHRAHLPWGSQEGKSTSGLRPHASCCDNPELEISTLDVPCSML